MRRLIPAAVILALAGCGTTTGTGEPTQAAAPTTSAAAKNPGIIHPSDAEKAAYLTAVRAVGLDGGRGDKPLINDASNTCLDLYQVKHAGEDKAIVAKRVAARIGISDPAKVEQFIKVAADTLCPTFR